MGETLEDGLNALFGSGAAVSQRVATQDSLSAAGLEPSVVGGGLQPVPSAGAAPAGAAPPSGAVGELLREAQSHYDRAIAAQRAGNWAEYGRQIEQLGAALRALRAGQH
jgi:uncharacterized membrane protein (UPF0182 family)